MRGQAFECPPLLFLQEIDHDYKHLILMDSPCSESQGEQPKRRGKSNPRSLPKCQNALRKKLLPRVKSAADFSLVFMCKKMNH